MTIGRLDIGYVGLDSHKHITMGRWGNLTYNPYRAVDGISSRQYVWRFGMGIFEIRWLR